jgi:hypothetical protein
MLEDTTSDYEGARRCCGGWKRSVGYLVGVKGIERPDCLRLRNSDVDSAPKELQ